jgi:dipeptidase E
VLYLVNAAPSDEVIREKITAADMVYVGGGNTRNMLKVWKQYGVDLLLREAWERGTVLSGLSAGSMCWFAGGMSDSARIEGVQAELVPVECLGFISAMHAPHYDVEVDRRPAIQKYMEHRPGVAIGLDNCCAMIIMDDTYRIITSKPTACAYRVYWKNGVCHEEGIPAQEEYSSLSELLQVHD